jgi:hypothetical protein
VAKAPVLLITGYDTADIPISSRPDSRTEVLCKPFNLQSLGQRIDRLLGIAAQR